MQFLDLYLILDSENKSNLKLKSYFPIKSVAKKKKKKKIKIVLMWHQELDQTISIAYSNEFPWYPELHIGIGP